MENRYELMLIVKASLDEKEEKKLVNKVTDAISEKGKVIKADNLGRKLLAYRIKKESNGNYWLFDVETESPNVSLLNSKLSSEENILRFLILKKIIKKSVKEDITKKV